MIIAKCMTVKKIFRKKPNQKNMYSSAAKHKITPKKERKNQDFYQIIFIPKIRPKADPNSLSLRSKSDLFQKLKGRLNREIMNFMSSRGGSGYIR